MPNTTVRQQASSSVSSAAASTRAQAKWRNPKRHGRRLFSADQGAIALRLYAFVHTAVVRSCPRPQSGAAAERPCCELEIFGAGLGGGSAGDTAGVCAGSLGAQLPGGLCAVHGRLGGFGLKRLRGSLGALLIGFSGSWLAGAVFWGWLRLHPLWHLPVEAFALPWRSLACRGLGGGLGSFIWALIGTACTDVATALCGLMPLWPSVLQASASEAPLLLSAAAERGVATVTTGCGGWFCRSHGGCRGAGSGAKAKVDRSWQPPAEHLGC